MFLVDDDQPGVRQRREDRGTRADNQFRVAAASMAPGVQAFDIRETGMQQSRLDAESVSESRDELRRKADLRHQHQNLFAPVERIADQVQIDFCLATARNTIEHAGAETARTANARKRTFLVLVQRRTGRAGYPIGRLRSVGTCLELGDETLPGKRLVGTTPCGHHLVQCVDIDAVAARIEKRFEEFGLPWRLFARVSISCCDRNR